MYLLRAANTWETQLECSLELGMHPAAPAALLGQERQQWELLQCGQEECGEWKLVFLDASRCGSGGQVSRTPGHHIHGNTKQTFNLCRTLRSSHCYASWAAITDGHRCNWKGKWLWLGLGFGVFFGIFLWFAMSTKKCFAARHFLASNDILG